MWEDFMLEYCNTFEDPLYEVCFNNAVKILGRMRAVCFFVWGPVDLYFIYNMLETTNFRNFYFAVTEFQDAENFIFKAYEAGSEMLVGFMRR